MTRLAWLAMALLLLGGCQPTNKVQIRNDGDRAITVKLCGGVAVTIAPGRAAKQWLDPNACLADRDGFAIDAGDRHWAYRTDQVRKFRPIVTWGAKPDAELRRWTRSDTALLSVDGAGVVRLVPARRSDFAPGAQPAGFPLTPVETRGAG
jgi:hypothetical protein